MSEGIRVPEADDLGAGEALVVDRDVTGTPDDIAIFRDDDGSFYALDDTCSHEEASLADGWIEACEVECPLHAARFSLKTGEALCLPATKPVTPHRVDVRDGQVWLQPTAP